MLGRKKRTGVPPRRTEDKIRIARVDNQIMLFGKFNNKWYSTQLEEGLTISNQHSPSANSIVTFDGPNKVKLIPRITAEMDGTLKIKSEDKSTGVSLKESSGILKVRNLTDNSDTDVRASRFTFDNSATTTGLEKGQLTFDHTNNAVGVTSNLHVSTTTGSIGDIASVTLLSREGDAQIQFYASSQKKWQLGYDRFKAATFTDNTCDTTSGSTTVSFDNGGTIDDTLAYGGSTVTGSGIPSNTFVSSVDSTANTLVLSNAATATASNVTLTFQQTDERFKINNNNIFADTSVFNLDGNGALELFGTSASLKLSYNANDYATLSVADTGDLTIATVGDGTTDSNLTLDADGGIYLDADNGTARLTDGGSTFTPAHADDLVTKAYVDSVKHTAVWGGALPRIGASGEFYGIPTGQGMAVLRMGTGLSPDTSYTVSTTGDDLVACIWASMHDITVTGCKIWVSQGGATNTTHGAVLMRYDIDADGDLTNGVPVATGGSLDSDDYSQARAHTLTLAISADDCDVDFSDGQILIAFVEPRTAYNAYMAAKVILEYTEVET